MKDLQKEYFEKNKEEQALELAEEFIDKKNISEAPSEEKIKTMKAIAQTHRANNIQPSNKEMSSLKRNNYQEAMNKYDTSYVILNKKTGLIAQIKAASCYHACTMIGWKPKTCMLLKSFTNKLESKLDSIGTSSNNEAEVELVQVENNSTTNPTETADSI